MIICVDNLCRLDALLNSPDIQKDGFSTVYHPTDHFYRELGLKCPSFSNRVLPVIVSFPCIYISQDGVATQLRCGGILNNRFVANCIRSVPVKEF